MGWIICKISFLSGQYAGSSSVFFPNQNFSRDRKVELLCKSITVVLQVKFRFIGCLVKANALVSGNRQHRRYHLSQQYHCFYETVICREIFSKHVFVSIFVNFQKILATHQKNVSKIFRKFTKNILGEVLFQLQAFTEAATEGVPKKSVLRKVFAEFTGRHLCQGFYFNKVTGLRL